MENSCKSRIAANSASGSFDCNCAHQMGEYWMPCKDHGAIMMEEDNHYGDDYSVYEQSGYDYSGY